MIRSTKVLNLAVAMLAIFGGFAVAVAWITDAGQACDSVIEKGAILPDGRVEPNGSTVYKQPRGCGKIESAEPWRTIEP